MALAPPPFLALLLVLMSGLLSGPAGCCCSALSTSAKSDVSDSRVINGNMKSANVSGAFGSLAEIDGEEEDDLLDDASEDIAEDEDDIEEDYDEFDAPTSNNVKSRGSKRQRKRKQKTQKVLGEENIIALPTSSGQQTVIVRATADPMSAAQSGAQQSGPFGVSIGMWCLIGFIGLVVIILCIVARVYIRETIRGIETGCYYLGKAIYYPLLGIYIVLKTIWYPIKESFLWIRHKWKDYYHPWSRTA
mmetsp:Transcript_4089/g.9614  ORF Transcript_4089/g.9614 Transcript_4089/m.9614 type:complete len:247 (-) Transcript_4089:157-897(-)